MNKFEKLKYRVHSSLSGDLFILASELFSQQDVQQDLNRLERTSLYQKLLANKKREAREFE